jgi:hypothetical protein
LEPPLQVIWHLIINVYGIIPTESPRFYDPSHKRSALSASKEHWPIVPCFPAGCQMFCLIMNVLTVLYAASHTGMYSDHYQAATIGFGVWSWNDNLTTALHSSLQAGGCYVTYRHGQGPLNRLGLLFAVLYLSFPNNYSPSSDYSFYCTFIDSS